MSPIVKPCCALTWHLITQTPHAIDTQKVAGRWRMIQNLTVIWLPSLLLENGETSPEMGAMSVDRSEVEVRPFLAAGVGREVSFVAPSLS